MSNSLREDGVSFCIPNWNHRSFLPRSIGSAINTVRALNAAGASGEIIVVDDASRDGSQRALAALALSQSDVLIDVILSPENRGLASTRMKAIERARFRYICFLDADNELLPDNFVDLWQAARDTNAAITYGNLLVLRAGRPVRFYSNDTIDKSILTYNYIDAFCIVDKLAIIQVGGYSIDLKTHEDWEFLLHFISEGLEIVFVPLIMGIYHIENVSMVQTVLVDHKNFHRIFNQRGLGLPKAFQGGRMYHPALGWL